nr:hypothetical protein [Moritella viscosa]SHN97544.1 Putative uncharacterized protein [Moritella viscosa]
MAKRRKGKIKILLSKPGNNNATRLSDRELPDYHHFVDAPDHSFRLFFEDPQSLDETTDPERKDKKFIRKPSGHNPFRIMVEGKALVGEDIAITFSILLSKMILNGSITNIFSACVKEHVAVSNFFRYLAGLDKPPIQFSDIRISHLSGWLSQLHPGNVYCHKLGLKHLIDLHPLVHDLDMSAILTPHRVVKSRKFNEIDFDEIVQTKDYSEKVHFQFLACLFFEIENAEVRLKRLEDLSPKVLGDDYIHPDNLTSTNPVVIRILESGEEGYKALIYHFYLYLDHPSTKNTRQAGITSSAAKFMSRIKEISLIVFKDSEVPIEFFYKFRRYLYSSEPNNWPLKDNVTSPIYPYLNLTSKHHEVAIFLYSLITLGINREVALSWLWEINGIAWYENYDIELGISNKSSARDKKIVLVGIKKKGKTPRVIKKSISINSPLFKFLMLLDKTRIAGRKHIFNFKSMTSYTNAFLKHYPIIDDAGNRLSGIETQRFRKSYLGYKTLSLLRGVKNSSDLVMKLKEALNHKSFDTTFSSYMMKSGMSRTVIDSAIVALTTKMLESSLTFKGQIKEDQCRSENNETVYLCDCNDPSNPTHELPIDNKCMKYDMCLGCERSEVYSEHLPAICYRIMQYEKKQEEEPDMFRITLEDRMVIARDTVEKFKVKHSTGMDVVEQAYVIANQAMLDDDPLLPLILQTGAL